MTSGRPAAAEPRMPVRTRILRPSLWDDETTGTLDDAAFRLYLGLATRSDDAGWLLWRPATLGAALYGFQAPADREALLASAAGPLEAAGLLVVEDCRCAFLPCLARDFRISGGNHAETVETFHRGHAGPAWTAPPRKVRTSPAPDSDSDSDSVSDSVSGAARREVRTSPDGAVVPTSALVERAGGRGQDDHVFEGRRRQAIAGIRDGTIDGRARAKAIADYRIADADLAAAVPGNGTAPS